MIWITLTTVVEGNTIWQEAETIYRRHKLWLISVLLVHISVDLSLYLSHFSLSLPLSPSPLYSSLYIRSISYSFPVESISIFNISNSAHNLLRLPYQFICFCFVVVNCSTSRNFSLIILFNLDFTFFFTMQFL